MLSINSSCYSSSEIDLPNYEYPVIATSCGRHVLYTHDSFCVNQKKTTGLSVTICKAWHHLLLY